MECTYNLNDYMYDDGLEDNDSTYSLYFYENSPSITLRSGPCLGILKLPPRLNSLFEYLFHTYKFSLF